ncbi:MAG: type II secretion system GspH family protein [Sulfuricellaceae bacterium]|nr:type II secretion system GspH family protein [Sulfuricellaceae bacterium]
MTTRRAAQNGFTLIEAIIVIVITGILSAIVAVFITRPVAGYVDASRRAQLTDAADGALRMMGRDIRSALPNSIRVSNNGTDFYLEFLATRAGGRFQQNDACFTSGVGCNQLLTQGSIINNFGAFGANDSIAIFNLYNNQLGDCSINNPSAYCGQNTVAVTGVAGANSDTLNFANTVFLPALGTSPPGDRFQIIDGTQQAVTYACNPAVAGVGASANGTGTLTRQWGYGINPVQAVPPNPPAGGTTALLAQNVSRCTIQYAQGSTENSGLVTIWLELMRNGESVSLNYQVHVSNVP